MTGSRPVFVEGSRGSVAVVADRSDGDHAKTGGEPGETLTIGQLMDALDGLDVETPVWLEVLGEYIDIEGVTIHPGGVRIVGAEDTSP